jgi:glycolate oxidase FAD binding subunit
MLDPSPPPQADTPATQSSPPDAVWTRWADTLRAAQAQGRPLRIRGGGTKDFYGPPLAQDLPVLDTREWQGIVAYEPTELVVTARAGTPLAALEAALAEQGQCLPFEPPHFGPGATVGGMVAAGLSGPARASVGAVRDYVLGLQMLNGRGEHLTFGGQVMKNVAGYDLSRLIAGSLGSLGVITEVSLKVLPVAPAEATLCFALGQAGPAATGPLAWPAPAAERQLLGARRHLRHGPGAAVRAPARRGGGGRGGLHTHARRCTGRTLDNAVAGPDWHACKEQTLPFFAAPPSADAALWRLSVAPTTRTLDVPGPTLIEWHGGLRWVWAPVSARDNLQDPGPRGRWSRHPVPRTRPCQQRRRPGAALQRTGASAADHPATAEGRIRPFGHFQPRPLGLWPLKQRQRHANPTVPRIPEHPRRPGRRSHSAQVRALRLLHRHLPHLPAAGR